MDILHIYREIYRWIYYTYIERYIVGYVTHIKREKAYMFVCKRERQRA